MREYLVDRNDPFHGVSPAQGATTTRDTQVSNRHAALFSLVASLGLQSSNIIGINSQSSMSARNKTRQDGDPTGGQRTPTDKKIDCKDAENNGGSD